jgi:hypothetical protein
MINLKCTGYFNPFFFVFEVKAKCAKKELVARVHNVQVKHMVLYASSHTSNYLIMMIKICSMFHFCKWNVQKPTEVRALATVIYFSVKLELFNDP